MRKTFLLTPLLLLAALSAQGRDDSKAAEFAYFEYTGNDDYYKNNPLPGDDYFYNPVLAGWHSDPSICRVDGDYFMVASTFCYYPGVPIFHSKDLVNWKQIGNVLNRPSQLPYLPGQDFGKGGIYAPTIRYNPHNKLFYMITTDVGALPYAHGKGAGGMAAGSHFYVTTDNPFSNNWSDPVWLPDIGGIDPDLFFDDDGSAYLIHKEDVMGNKPKWSNYRALRIIRFDTKTGKTFGEDMPFCEYGVGQEEKLPRDEGPHIYKIKGRYYVVCAEGGTGFNHSAVVYRSDNVTGPYERWSRNPMITQRTLKDTRQDPVTCTGHADLVEAPDGKWWAVFLGCRPGPNGVEQLGRETFMLPVRWSKDGFPYLLSYRESVPLTLRCEGTKREPTVMAGNFTWRDDFDDEALRPEWLSMWGTAVEYYTLKKHVLRLKPSATLPSDRKPTAYIGRRMQHIKYSCETEMRFSPCAGEIAGIAVMRNENRHYIMGLRRNSDGGTEAALLKADKNGYTTLASLPVSQKLEESIRLKVVCNGSTYGFMFSSGNGDWTQLATAIPADYTSQKAGGFIGSTIGVCALKIN